MSPALNGSSGIQRFEHAYAIEIRDGIMFVFYPGLPHMHSRLSLYRGMGLYLELTDADGSPTASTVVALRVQAFLVHQFGQLRRHCLMLREEESVHVY